MRKLIKILIISAIALILLVVPFSVSAVEANDFIFTGAISNSAWVNVDHRPYVVVSGYNNGSAVGFYQTSVNGEVSYVFRVPIKLTVGDIFSLSGTIVVPQECNLIQIICYNHYFTQVDYMGTCGLQDPQGSNVFYGKFYGFNLSFNEDSTNSSDELIIILSWQSGTHTSFRSNFLGVQTLQYSLNNNPSVALNQQAQIINNNNNQNAQAIISAQQSAVSGQTNEQFGYVKPGSNNTDSGLSSGGNLIDSLNVHIDNFNSSLSSNVDNLLDNISGFKTIVSSVFNIIPTLLQYLIIFGLTFIVIRKVVGR